MKLRKIVVGLDATPLGEHALSTARRLARAARAGLIALTVVEPGRRAAGASPQVADDVAHRRTRVGAPGIEIPRCAEEHEADLIVLGRCPKGPGALRRTGTATEGTLRRTRVPVLIVPEGHAVTGPVLVALAGDGASSDVLDAALELSRLLDVPLAALHVEPEYALAGIPAAPGRNVLEDLSQRCPTPPEVIVRRGDPAREILAAVRARPGAVLVVGRRRGSAALDREADSVAARVLGAAPGAVLVIPV